MTLMPDFTAALGQTIFGEGGKSFTDPNRVPMIFTSLKRLRAGGIDTSARLSGIESQSPELQLSEYTLSATPVSGIMTAIEMAVNPNSISFRQPKRITKRDTQEGSVFFHFTNSKGENNDILTVDFRGNTGNLDIRGDIATDRGLFSTQGGFNTGANRKLAVWHNLWALTREAMLLDDNTRNEFMIQYSSIGMPVEIFLIGHYSNVLEFSENADKPFTRDYSMSFTVQEIVPTLDDIASLIQEITIDTTSTAGQT